VIWYEKAVPVVALAVVALVMTGAARLMVSVRVAVPVPPLLVALRLTVDVPAAVGDPEISPVVLANVKPVGKPMALKLVGAFVAAIWYEKAVPVVPLAVVALLITGSARLTVSVRVALPAPPALVALRDTVEVPAAVGVPEINPVVLFSVRPAGSPVAP
jgi:hypothetical protein